MISKFLRSHSNHAQHKYIILKITILEIPLPSPYALLLDNTSVGPTIQEQQLICAQHGSSLKTYGKTFANFLGVKTFTQ